MAWLAAVHSEYIDKSPLDDIIQGLRNFRTKANVPEQVFRVIYVDWLRCHIEVAYPHDRVGRVEILFEKFQQSLEPVQLVPEFFGLGRIALRNVSVDDDDACSFSHNQTGLVFRFVVEAEFCVFKQIAQSSTLSITQNLLLTVFLDIIRMLLAILMG